MSLEAKLREVASRHKEELLRLANVVGFSERPQPRIRGGRVVEGELCLRIYVERKLPLAKLAARDVIPKEVEGIPTDVVEVGLIRALGTPPADKQKRWRPAPGGVSIAHRDVTAGTLTCAVYSRDRRKVYVLSNNHVIANSNQGSIGDPILQPGPYDGGADPADRIAVLSKFIPIQPQGSGENQVDAAIGEVLDPSYVSDEILDVGVPRPPVPEPYVNLTVKKSGRTTCLKEGTVIDDAAYVKVYYGAPFQYADFRDQIMIQPAILQGGDSGSPILYGRSLIGLGFAGSDVISVANKFLRVLELLEVVLPVEKATVACARCGLQVETVHDRYFACPRCGSMEWTGWPT
jgi:ribosomal protein S27AE